MNWPSVALGEICDVRIGRTPSRSDASLWNGDLPWVSISELNGGTITTTKECIAVAALSKMPPIVPAGTLLFSFKLSIGKMAITGIPLFTNEAIAALVIKDANRVRRDYLKYALMTLTFESADGAVLGKVLNKGKVAGLRIPLPPLDEQDRLVGLLDEADALRKLRAQAETRTAQIIPAIFQEMFGSHLKGPVVTTWRKDRDVPKGWQFKKLTDVAKLSTGHTPSRRNAEYWIGETPWLTTGEIRSVDGREVHDTRERITEAGLRNSSAVLLPKGTVCLSRTASVGFVTMMGRPMATSQDFVNWTCGEELHPFYLMNAIISSRDHIRQMSSGSTHKTIYFPTVEQFAVAIPPKHQQERFAAYVPDLRNMEALQLKSRVKVEALWGSLLGEVLG